MDFTLFIHCNKKQKLGAQVAAHSFISRSKRPRMFEVRLIEVENYPALTTRDGEHYLREGRQSVWKMDDLQSFTPTRFLPPQLMGFKGRAVVTDPDVFALADVMELFERDMQGKSILARQIRPEGRRPYFASSVMLLDCEKLRHWNWEVCIAEMFAGKRDYRDWMSLWLEEEWAVGLLEEEWNHYDTLTPQTKFLHNTRRLTQPWKTGLPIDFNTEKDSREKRLKEKAFDLARKSWRTLKGTAPPKTYQPHPDSDQEDFFFSLLKECLDSGKITETDLHSEVAQKHVRADVFKFLQNTAPAPTGDGGRAATGEYFPTLSGTEKDFPDDRPRPGK